MGPEIFVFILRSVHNSERYFHNVPVTGTNGTGKLCSYYEVFTTQRGIFMM